MKNTKAIYTLEITLEDGMKVVKIGYADDINERFKDSSKTPITVLYIDDVRRAKAFVSSIKDYYEGVEVVKGFYPIKYSTILELRIIDFENELKWEKMEAELCK